MSSGILRIFGSSIGDEVDSCGAPRGTWWEYDCPKKGSYGCVSLMMTTSFQNGLSTFFLVVLEDTLFQDFFFGINLSDRVLPPPPLSTSSELNIRFVTDLALSKTQLRIKSTISAVMLPSINFPMAPPSSASAPQLPASIFVQARNSPTSVKPGTCARRRRRSRHRYRPP